MGSIGPIEIVLLGVVALLLFGPNRLPEIGRQLGKGMRDFKQSLEGTGIKEALDSVNEVKAAVSPAGAARNFLASDAPLSADEAAAQVESVPAGAPVVAGVVTPTVDQAAAPADSVTAPEGAAVAVEPTETQP